MRREVAFDLFGENQTIYFDIARLRQFEEALGDSLMNIIFVKNMDNSISFCLNGLRVGLAHHYPGLSNDFFIVKIEEYLENGGKLADIIAIIGKTLFASGIFGEIEGLTKKTAPDEAAKNAPSPLIQ